MSICHFCGSVDFSGKIFNGAFNARQGSDFKRTGLAAYQLYIYSAVKQLDIHGIQSLFLLYDNIKNTAPDNIYKEATCKCNYLVL